MTTNTATLIKIGDSTGVTIPAKALKQAGLKPGDQVRISFEPLKPPSDDVLQSYAAFKKQYGETLKHLANR